jgi:hypothetical protein
MSLKGFQKIIREILSEPAGGTLSWGRCAATFALLSGVTWVTKIVLHTHALPDLTGVAAFSTAPYVANKVSAAAQSFSNNPVTAVQPAQFIQPPQA